MPTNYTPVPGNAPATITLPSDLDDANAESVNLAFRAVEDNLMGLAALKAATNVFTAAGQEVQNNDAYNAAWVVVKDALNDTNAGNLWKNILEAKVAGCDGRMRLYTGKVTVLGQIILVFNAKWDTANQRWFPDDTGFASIGLQFEENAGLRLGRRAPGAGTWTDWSALTTGSFVAQGDLACNGDVITAGRVRATTAFDFVTSIARSKLIPYQKSVWSSGVSLTSGGSSITLPPNTRVEIPIELPSGATIDTIKGVVATVTSADWTFTAYKQAPNFSTGVFGSWSSFGTASGTVNSGSTPDPVSFSAGSEVVANNTTTYIVVVVNANTSTSDLAVGPLRVDWHDPGPRNY